MVTDERLKEAMEKIADLEKVVESKQAAINIALACVKPFMEKLARIRKAGEPLLRTTWVPLHGVQNWTYAEWKNLFDAIAEAK